jgi:tetratricopeptide (TPR) repeat protein
VIIGIGVVFVSSEREAKSKKSQDALFIANRSLDKAIDELNKKNTPAVKADPKKPAPPSPENTISKVDVNEAFKTQIDSYKGLIEKFPGTRAAFEANLAVGDLFLNRDVKGEGSIAWYEAALKIANSTLEKGFATYSLAYSFEKLGKYKEALEQFEKAQSLKIGDIAFKADLYMGIARVSELSGNSEKAKSTYDQLIKEMPNSEYAPMAEILKSKIDIVTLG